jgi:hypothetical protein
MIASNMNGMRPYLQIRMQEVYSDFKRVNICTDQDICSAKPALDDFEITAEDLFS